MPNNVLIVPILGLDNAGISDILDSARNLSSQVRSWTIKTVSEDPCTDLQLGNLRCLSYKHPQFNIQTISIRAASLAFKILEAFNSAEDNTLILVERSVEYFQTVPVQAWFELRLISELDLALFNALFKVTFYTLYLTLFSKLISTLF